MIIDGKRIAEGIYNDLRSRVTALQNAPILTIFTCNPNFETQKYLSLKERKARDIGVQTVVIHIEETCTTEEFVSRIHSAVPVSDGIIVQLPLPVHIESATVLQSVPVSHDVDVLGGTHTNMLSPVVGAFKEILEREGISRVGKYVNIIGSGRLVGLPASAWFMNEGAHVSVVTKDTHDIVHYTKNADIVVCGAGVPGLLKPDMVKEDVVILDAGTSEDGGVLRGDADPACALKARVFTPVPGGIGPITIAILLRNVVDCATQKQGVV